MLISVPLFSDTTYLDDNTSYDIGLKMMSAYDPGSDAFNSMFYTFVYNQVRINFPLVLASCYNITWEASGVDVSFFYLIHPNSSSQHSEILNNKLRLTVTILIM